MFNKKTIVFVLIVALIFYYVITNNISLKQIEEETNDLKINKNNMADFHKLQYNDIKLGNYDYNLGNYDYNKVKEITGWDIDLVVFFVNEAQYRGVSIYEEAIPILSIETGNTFKFDLISYNSDGTINKGAFQINTPTYNYIIEQLKKEGRTFETWDKLNPELNIASGLYWIAYLKNEHDLREDSLFTSYNRGVGGARSYYKRNNTYETEYSKKAKFIKYQLLNN